MSIRFVSQALDLDLPPSEKIVLVVYANYADEHGYAYPSVPTVAKKASLSERQTRRLIHKLTDDGYLQAKGKKSFMGRKVNVYLVRPHAPVKVDSPPDNMSGLVNPPPDTGDRRPLTPVSGNPSVNRHSPVDESTGALVDPAKEERAAMFEAMAEVWFGETLAALKGSIPKTQRQRLNAGVKEALEVGIDPREYRRRGGYYRQRYAGLSASPQAVLGNWATLTGLSGTRRAVEPKAIDPEECDHLWQTYEDGGRACVKCKLEDQVGRISV